MTRGGQLGLAAVVAAAAVHGVGTARRYQTFCAATADAERIYAPKSDDEEWTDENRERALDLSQSSWDALPLWLRVALCLRCDWIDAVYEVSPALGERLIERRVGRLCANCGFAEDEHCGPGRACPGGCNGADCGCRETFERRGHR